MFVAYFIVQMLMITLKAMEKIKSSWWVVFIPTYFMLVISALVLVVFGVAFATMEG